MKIRDFLQKWGLSSLKLNVGFLEAEFAPSDVDREAAWDLYVELLTRITTQDLAPQDGDEATALTSVFSLFKTTREILKHRGSGCGEFAKIAIPVLNQVIRPFTAKWHKKSVAGELSNPEACEEFRQELIQLQSMLKHYTSALSAMAMVEDLTSLEEE